MPKHLTAISIQCLDLSDKIMQIDILASKLADKTGISVYLGYDKYRLSNENLTLSERNATCLRKNENESNIMS